MTHCTQNVIIISLYKSKFVLVNLYFYVTISDNMIRNRLLCCYCIIGLTKVHFVAIRK